MDTFTKLCHRRNQRDRASRSSNIQEGARKVVVSGRRKRAETAASSDKLGAKCRFVRSRCDARK